MRRTDRSEGPPAQVKLGLDVVAGAERAELQAAQRLTPATAIVQVRAVTAVIRSLSTELVHDLVGDVVVRVDILDVVGVLESLDQPEYLLGVVLVQVDLD